MYHIFGTPKKEGRIERYNKTIDNLQDMAVLRDYIAYAREHVHPKLTDEAQQKLIQCYVDMRKIGSGRGQISAYPRKYTFIQ